MFNIFGKKKDKQEEMSNRKNLEVAKSKLKDYKRVTFKPITNNKFTSFESSKLGGLPYIPKEKLGQINLIVRLLRFRTSISAMTLRPFNAEKYSL